MALSEIPDILETTCIIERDDGTIELDEKMLECEEMVGKLREMLAGEGVEGEVRYEGRMRGRKEGGERGDRRNMRDMEEASGGRKLRDEKESVCGRCGVGHGRL